MNQPNRHTTETKKKLSRREMLRMEVMEDREKYDFKYVQRNFQLADTKDKVYIDPDQLNRLIRQP